MSDIDNYHASGGKGLGGLEAASRNSREMATWNASPLPMDVLFRYDKDTIDDRARDVILNDGYASGAMTIHKDNIVGSQFRLNAQPNSDVLGIDDEEWLYAFQRQAESRFNNTASSTQNWLDASGVNDFTALIRQAVGMFLVHGEVVAVAEWITDAKRPYNTAIQVINPKRLSTPDYLTESASIKSGIERDSYGRAIAYHIREAHPFDFSDTLNKYKWKRIEATTTWGRQQVIHIIDQLMPDQIRGVSELVSVLKQMRMTRRFQDVELQQAVLQATYAATLETDMPPNIIGEIMGANPNAPSFESAAKSVLTSVARSEATRNLQVDGVRIPVLHPNTKLHLQQLGQPSGTGSEYEQSLLRHIAAGLGLSYEQFSRDYSKTNYSSARASMNETYKFMQARKKSVADKLATAIYRLWLEEQISMGTIPLPKGKHKTWIYKPDVFDALANCSWIGASRGQIDEMKETQAAILKINAGLSTLEAESAKLGVDWRETLQQRKREQDEIKRLGIEISNGAEKAVVSKKPASQDDSQSENGTEDKTTDKEGTE